MFTNTVIISLIFLVESYYLYLFLVAEIFTNVTMTTIDYISFASVYDMYSIVTYDTSGSFVSKITNCQSEP
jgi:hypothetical protein